MRINVHINVHKYGQWSLSEGANDIKNWPITISFMLRLVSNEWTSQVDVVEFKISFPRKIFPNPWSRSLHENYFKYFDFKNGQTILLENFVYLLIR
jgi:hypothetical protein